MRSYQNQLWNLAKKQQAEMTTYLSGLFTSKYGNEFFLHYVCPLCGEQVNLMQKVADDGPVTIDYSEYVMGEMAYKLKQELAKHYASLCATTRIRRNKSAEILLDKLQDRVYE